MLKRWDIFCRVVDNFGDAGVCWRLARQLAHEHGFSVCLWIDDLDILARLEPEVVVTAHQCVQGIELVQWNAQAEQGALDAQSPDVVIEAFGCGLPETYLASISRAPQSPLWIVLEYLSAEPWVREHHGLPSPHPQLPIKRYFFFPGFVEGTGGLLRERDLFSRRDAFDKMRECAFWRSIGHAPLPADAIAISMFSYDSAPLPQLLDIWKSSAERIVLAMVEGVAAKTALLHLGLPADSLMRVARCGSLEMRIVPFVPQVQYDALLWSFDLNFVRGEDSFVRALWAARPLVWHIYPQQARAHWQKLEAFLALYTQDLTAPAAQALMQLTHFWNGIDARGGGLHEAWGAFMQERHTLQAHAKAWCSRIAEMNDLAEQLARFSQDKLK
ncbi:MAG: elongation factor P maturation arginine rhamnosyltransferase EarP [Pseudomonadota bacterium]